MIKEFKKFALRGNMVDLAVGIIIGGAFGAVVKSLAEDVMMRAIVGVIGKRDYRDLHFNVQDSQVLYGNFLTQVVSFLLVAVALFFVVKAINRMLGPRDAPPEPTARRECPYCTTSIPVVATRCPACTSEVGPVSA